MKACYKQCIYALLCPVFLLACSNQHKEFEDFKFSATYFGWQYPVRTLVLGESEFYDNTNDRNHVFEIKASLGGMYANKKDVRVGFEIDHSLLENLESRVEADKSEKLEILPPQYYEALEGNSFLIPKGQFNGGIKIKLKDEFFADPAAVSIKYVLPLRITSSETDSVLQGTPSLSATASDIPSVAQKWGVDPRVLKNWMIPPKNFTIYAVKYINKYHGVYFRRGTEVDENGGTAKITNYGWENAYIEKTIHTPLLSSLSLSKTLYAAKTVKSQLLFNAVLELNGSQVNISTFEDSDSIQVSGSGSYASDLEEWGGKKRNSFYLDFQLTNVKNGQKYAVKDTLVFRDNAVAVQQFVPVVK